MMADLRKPIRWLISLGGLLLLPLAVAAPAGSAGLPRVSAARSHVQCPLTVRDETALLLDSQNAWHALAAGSARAALGRPVRWGQERLLVYAMGMQPSLGYAVQLPADRPVHQSISRSGHRLELTLEVIRPAPDAMVATALSSPCLIAALTRGPWRELQVVDQQGQRLGPRLTPQR